MVKQEFYSRYDDPTPVQCEDCGWRGRVMDCVHTYHDDGTTNLDGSPTGEVEAIDECPDCGSDKLFDIEVKP